MSQEVHKNRSVLLDRYPQPVTEIPTPGRGTVGAFKKSQNRYARLVRQLAPTPGVPHRIGSMKAGTPAAVKEATKAAGSLRTTLSRYGIKVEARKVKGEMIFYGTFGTNGQ